MAGESGAIELRICAGAKYGDSYGMIGLRGFGAGVRGGETCGNGGGGGTNEIGDCCEGGGDCDDCTAAPESAADDASEEISETTDCEDESDGVKDEIGSFRLDPSLALWLPSVELLVVLPLVVVTVVCRANRASNCGWTVRANSLSSRARSCSSTARCNSRSPSFPV